MIIISTWNVYGMPFTSPKLLTRQKKWRQEHDSLVIKAVQPYIQNKKNIDNSCLAVACFQECWDFRVGITKPLFYMSYFFEKIGLSSYFIKNIVNVIRKRNVVNASDFSIIVYSLSLLLGYFLPNVYWNSKKRLIQKNNSYLYNLSKCFCNKSNNNIPYKYYIGKDCCYFPSFYKRPIMDSGLFMTSTEKPTHYGFIAFSITSFYESFVQKGLLWAYFKKRKLLVINTHLIDDPESNYQQWQVFELCKLIDIVEKNMYERYDALDSIIIAGDFNFLPNGECAKILSQFGYTCISNTAKPTHCKGKVLDYIYTKKNHLNIHNPSVHYSYEALDTTTSDHSIVCSFIENL